jgi:uncharacterized protein
MNALQKSINASLTSINASQTRINASQTSINASLTSINASQTEMNAQEQNNLDATLPWWRQRWPWLLMVGPAAAIAGCIVTIVLAFHGFSDQAIFDSGVKRGLVVERVTAQTPAPQPR